MKKGEWKIKSGDGTVFRFLPIFDVKGEGPSAEVECKEIIMSIGEKDYRFNYINLFQFIYFTANEELRQGLLQRHQRQINHIPYDVSFKLDKEEIQKGFAKRRVNLPIDELIMALARNEAWKLMPGISKKIFSGTKPNELFRGK